MSIIEIILALVCILSVGAAMHFAVRRPEFSAALDAWAKRHSRETEKALITAYADGHADGQEYERLHGSRPTIAP